MSKIYLSSKGVKPTIDNSVIINNAISKAKDGDVIVFPDGAFPIHSTILQNKVLHWETTNRNTQILALSTALNITGNPDRKSFISNIDFINYSEAEEGLIISSVVVMENIQVNGFRGNGITVSADVSSGTNASGSIFRNLLIANNGKNGMLFQGGDANKCSCYDIDVRDNGETGIDDSSFLGNFFSGCMAHNNKRNYAARDANNRATFIGCYSEQGSLPEYLAGAATWHGGLPANGFELHSWAKVFINEENARD